jgi:hypothetical protein
MIGRMLKIAALAALVAAAPARAQLRRDTPISSEAALVLQRLFEHGPYRTWDDLRAATPATVRWHLAPPDESEAQTFRRSGWIAAGGQQAGVAACGVDSGPELVSLRVAGATSGIQIDPVIGALEQELEVSLGHNEPTMVGEIQIYELRSGSNRASLHRVTDCSSESSRAGRRCETTYTLDVRPNYRSAPATRDCRAP